MTKRSGTDSVSNKMAKILKQIGLAVFLIQLLLAIISFLSLQLVLVNKFPTNPFGINLSIFLAISGLISLVIGIYQTHTYIRRAGKLFEPNKDIATKLRIDKIIKNSAITGLVGALFSGLGVVAIAGVMFYKILTFKTFGLFNESNPEPLVRVVDVFLYQTCFSIMAASCLGAISSLWILYKLEKLFRQSTLEYQ